MTTKLEEILQIRFNVWNLSIVAVTLVISFLNICFGTFLSVFVFKKLLFGPSVRLLLGTFLLSLVVYSSSIVIGNVQMLTSSDSFLLVTEQTCILRNTSTGLGYLMMTFSIIFLAIERLYSACRLLKSDHDSTKSILLRFVYPICAIVASMLLSSLMILDKIQKSNTQVILVCLAAKNADTLTQSIWLTILLTILTGTAAVMSFLSKLKINRLLNQFAWFATKTATLRTRFWLSVNVERSAVIFPQALLFSLGCTLTYSCWLLGMLDDGKNEFRRVIWTKLGVLVQAEFALVCNLLLFYTDRSLRSAIQVWLGRLRASILKPRQNKVNPPTSPVVQNAASNKYFNELNKMWN